MPENITPGMMHKFTIPHHLRKKPVADEGPSNTSSSTDSDEEQPEEAGADVVARCESPPPDLTAGLNAPPQKPRRTAISRRMSLGKDGTSTSTDNIPDTRYVYYTFEYQFQLISGILKIKYQIYQIVPA